MAKYLIFVFAMLMGFGLAACGQRALIDKMTPEEEATYAKHFVQLLQAHDFVEIEKQFAPNSLTAEQRQGLSAIASLLPPDPPISITTEGVNFKRNADTQTTQMLFQYEFHDKWVFVDISVVRNSDHALQLWNVRITPLPSSMQVTNAFKLGGKPLTSYLAAGVVLATILFIAVSLIVCVMSAKPRWRWKPLWCLAMFVGVAHLYIDWTTGQITFDPMRVSWFSAWIGRLGPDGPFYCESVLPIGAIAYWIWRQNWQPSRPDKDIAANFD